VTSLIERDDLVGVLPTAARALGGMWLLAHGETILED
jgi:hypothetical protein